MGTDSKGVIMGKFRKTVGRCAICNGVLVFPVPPGQVPPAIENYFHPNGKEHRAVHAVMCKRCGTEHTMETHSILIKRKGNKAE